MTAIRPYLELMRPANVATALGDVLAGYAVAGLGNHAALPWLLLSTASLYAGGVVLNDFFDREVDRVERPERPIPSGRIAAESAAILGAILLAAGVLTASMATGEAALVALLTAGCVLLYDAWGKRHAILGPVNMGLCRGLNLLLGVAAVPQMLFSSWFLAGFPLVYIAAVTAVSRGEVHGGQRRVAACALVSLGLVLIALLGLTIGAGIGLGAWAGGVLTVVLAWRVMPPFWAAYQSPAPATIRDAVKAGVLSLAILDAAIGAAYAGALYSLAILATALVAGMLARAFAVT
jgi:4-hydroxybenzoate polyprenyltransferase